MDATTISRSAAPAFVLARTSAQIFMRDSMTTRRADGTQFRVFPGYVDAAAPNAFAACSGALHLCALHSGLVTQLLDFAFFVLAQGDAFPEIGNARGEVSPPLTRKASLIRWDHRITQGATALPAIPRCPVRFAFAETSHSCCCALSGCTSCFTP